MAQTKAQRSGTAKKAATSAAKTAKAAGGRGTATRKKR